MDKDLRTVFNLLFFGRTDEAGAKTEETMWKWINDNFVSKNELDTLMEGNSTWESGWNHGYDELGETLLAEFREKGTITIDELERFLNGN